MILINCTSAKLGIKTMVENGATLVEIPILYTISEEQRKNNLDYIYFIKNMIENIKSEVY